MILAAGKGTRMKSDLPKVAHEVCGRPMVGWVVDAARAVGADPVVVVVGHRQDVVRAIFPDDHDVRFVEQLEQLGTGHAVQQAEPVLGTFAGDVLVLCGDGPLIRAETLCVLLDAHRDADAAATLATALLEDPSGYGRIVRDETGGFRAIVEEANATPGQKRIREVNPSYYAFRAGALFPTLARVPRDPRKGEYYLTDVPGLLKDAGETVAVVDAVPAEDVLSINTPEQLARVEEVLAARPARAADERSSRARQASRPHEAARRHEEGSAR